MKLDLTKLYPSMNCLRRLCSFRTKFSILFIFFSILLCGCFSRYNMTEKQIREHYHGTSSMPSFHEIRNDSVTLFCAVKGSDTLPPLLLIHGAPGGWFGYIGILDDSDICKHYQVISVDRPGYHFSRFKGKRKALTSIYKQSVAIHEALALNRSGKAGVVLGSSYGGPIAAKITYLFPAAFRQAILLAPAIDPDREKFWWFSKIGRMPIVRGFLPHFLNAATDEKFSHVTELKKMMAEWDRIRVPITVVQGDADKIVDPANLDFAKAHLHLPGDAFILVPGAHHLLRNQHPELVKALLLQPVNPIPVPHYSFNTN